MNYLIKREMRYTITRTNVHIYNSYQYSKHDLYDAITYLKEQNPDSAVLMARRTDGLFFEWLVHNALLKLKIQQGRTRDVDLNYPRKWWEPVGYFLLFPIAWIIAD